MAARFQVPPPHDAIPMPEHVMAVDGSYHESSLDDKLPSTKVGYVKIGCILIELAEYNALRIDGGRFVDPFRVAALENNNSPLTFALPSANIKMKGRSSVRDGFRFTLDQHLYGPKTRFTVEDPSTSLRTTLFHLAAERSGELGTGDVSKIKIHKCPTCEFGPLELSDVASPQACSNCGAEVYPTDCLRVWEEVTDFQSNVQAMSRFMLQVEHLLPLHYIRYLLHRSPQSLSSLAFFIDGPLAVFGQGAWLHACILKFLDKANAVLKSLGLSPILTIGLQKTGQVVDHVALIERFLPKNRIYAIEDDYRYQYILAGRDPSSHGFGSETYYGQDFIFKTPSGRFFVFAIPYPFATKDISPLKFVQEKAKLDSYPQLPRALALINHFETDLYQNAVVPIALAHRYTAISLSPGSKVLDVLTHKAMSAKS